MTNTTQHSHPCSPTRRVAPKSTPEAAAAAASSTPLSAGGSRSSSDDKLHSKNRTKQEAHGALVKTNAEIFRLSNDGRFPAKVSLSFAEQSKVNRKSKPKRAS